MSLSFTRLTDNYPWLRVLLGMVLGYITLQLAFILFRILYNFDFNYLLAPLFFFFRSFFTSPMQLFVPLGTALWLIYRRTLRDSAGIRRTFLTALALAALLSIVQLAGLLADTATQARFRDYFAYFFYAGYDWIKYGALLTTLSWWALPADDDADEADGYPVLKIIAGFTLLAGLLTGCLFFLQVLIAKGSLSGAPNISKNMELYAIPALFFANWIAWRGLHRNARDIRRALRFALIPLVLYFTYHGITNIYFGGNLPYALAAAFLVCLRPAIAILILSLVLLPTDEETPQDAKAYAALFAGMLGYLVALIAVLIVASVAFFYLLVKLG